MVQEVETANVTRKQETRV